MKQQAILVTVLCLGAASVSAQFAPGGGRGAGPNLGGNIAKLFGDITEFSGDLEMQIKSQQGPVTMPGKIAFADGRSRFELDLTQMKSTMIPPGASEQMKAMGMDKMVIISRPDKKVSYLIYPGLKAHVQMPMDEAEAKPAKDFKIETTELGKETFDGHACVKNKAVVTDDKGTKHEATLWNATDLNKFPIKIEQSEGGNEVTMLFKDLKFAKPETSQFDAPADSTKYENMQEMMQQVMMKRLGGSQPPK